MPRARKPKKKKMPPKISRLNKAEVYCVLGASGSGKTSWVMQELRRKKPKRLLIWDTKGEFASEGYALAVDTLSEVVQSVAAAGKVGAFAISYRPRGDEKKIKAQFDLFCELAFQAKKLSFVAEELADVTTASHACAGWRRVSSQGRTEGLTVYGLSQHPASIDKHFFGNASLVRSGRLNFDSHVKAVANVLGVPPDEIRAMRPLDWVARDMNSGVLTRGKITF